jgi:hypothetical protein
MQTDLVTIMTPFEDSCYEPDWRSRLATAMMNDPRFKHPVPATMRDPYVWKAVKYMRAAKTSPARLDPDRLRFDRVQRWGTGDRHRQTGHVIEALLLTDAPLEDIAGDMGCAVGDVQLYERLFFSVRADDGSMTLAPAQKAFYATEGTYRPTQTRPEHLMWRHVAVGVGYRALLQILGMGSGSWDSAPKVDVVEVTIGLGRAEALSKVAAGGMNLNELSRMETTRIKERLLRHATGELKYEGKAMITLMSLMKLMAPKMLEVYNESNEQAIKATQNTCAAQNAIAQTPVEDMGTQKGFDEINAQLRKKLRPESFASEQGRHTANGQIPGAPTFPAAPGM